MKRKSFIKKILIVGVVLIICIVSVSIWVSESTKSRVYSSENDIPYNKVGLLLGTSRLMANGAINPYYKYRIDAALKLYKAHKISYILVSGDNGRKGYDEPSDFKNDLIEQGVPEKMIYLDYAGFRTHDSVVRCEKIFGQHRFTIISQKFHNERALFIAKHENLDAIAFDADAPSRGYAVWSQTREALARVKMLLDFAIHRQPKFFGEKIIIGN